MKTKITVDNRECGAGKTRGEFGNINRIKRLIALGERVILAVPSIAMFATYLDPIDGIPELKSLNSVTEKNVQSSLHAAISSGTQAIIITHTSLLMAQLTSQTRSLYHLIVDEKFEPWNELSYKKDPLVPWSDIIGIDPDPVFTKWHRLHLSEDMREGDITETSPFLKSLYDANWCNYIHRADYDRWLDDEESKVNFIQELTPSIFADWISVHISAAAIENTFLGWWMTRHGIDYQITHEFTRHTAPVTIHCMNIEKWSKGRRDKDSDIISTFHDYIDAFPGEKLRLHNLDEQSILTGQEKLQHNTAGMNEYRGYKNVVLESSLNPNNTSRDWYVQICLEYSTDSLADAAYRFAKARTGYLFYQTLMRSCLRDGEPCDVFIIDRQTAESLIEYFDVLEYYHNPYIEIPYEARPVNQGGRAFIGRSPEEVKAQAAARQKKYRARQKEKKQQE